MENSDPNSAQFYVRYADEQDADALLAMMWELAQFEGYAPNFVVTREDLLARGLATDFPQFRALMVLDADGLAVGYAVFYEVAFTYDLRPNWHLKELSVREHARSLGVGKLLMEKLIEDARLHKVGRLKWDVLPNNETAKRFYRRFQAQPVTDWQAWILHL